MLVIDSGIVSLVVVYSNHNSNLLARPTIGCTFAVITNDIRLLQFLVYTKRPLMLAEAIEVIATKID